VTAPNCGLEIPGRHERQRLALCRGVRLPRDLEAWSLFVAENFVTSRLQFHPTSLLFLLWESRQSARATRIRRRALRLACSIHSLGSRVSGYPEPSVGSVAHRLIARLAPVLRMTTKAERPMPGRSLPPLPPPPRLHFHEHVAARRRALKPPATSDREFGLESLRTAEPPNHQRAHGYHRPTTIPGSDT
jgi:hypothetical protein